MYINKPDIIVDKFKDANLKAPKVIKLMNKEEEMYFDATIGSKLQKEDINCKESEIVTLSNKFIFEKGFADIFYFLDLEESFKDNPEYVNLGNESVNVKEFKERYYNGATSIRVVLSVVDHPDVPCFIVQDYIFDMITLNSTNSKLTSINQHTTKEELKSFLLNNLDKEVYLGDTMDVIEEYIDLLCPNVNIKKEQVNSILEKVLENRFNFNLVFDPEWKDFSVILKLVDFTQIDLKSCLSNLEVNKQDLSYIDRFLETKGYHIEDTFKKFLEFIKLTKPIDEDYMYWLDRNNLSIEIYNFINNVLHLSENFEKHYIENLLKLVKDNNFKIITIEDNDLDLIDFSYNKDLKSFIDLKVFTDLFFTKEDYKKHNLSLAINIAHLSPILSLRILEKNNITDDEKNALKMLIDENNNYKDIYDVFFKNYYSNVMDNIFSVLDKRYPDFQVEIFSLIGNTRKIQNVYSVNEYAIFDVLLKDIFFGYQTSVELNNQFKKGLDANRKLKLLRQSLENITSLNNLNINNEGANIEKLLTQQNIYKNIDENYFVALYNIEDVFNNPHYIHLVEKNYKIKDLKFGKEVLDILYLNKNIQPVLHSGYIGSYFKRTYFDHNLEDRFIDSEMYGSTIILPEAKAVYITEDDKVIVVNNNNNIHIY